MKFTIAILLASLFLPCKAQSYDPLALSRKIFSTDTLPDIKKYCAGDYTGHPNGRDISTGLAIAFELLEQNNKTAVVAITLSDSTGISLDTYMHFIKDSIWKISGFRTLAMTGLTGEIYQQLSTLSPIQVDSVLQSPHTRKKDMRLFKSRGEYQFMLGNTKLILSSDKDLIEHFNKNKAQFFKLKNELIAAGIYKSQTGTKRMKGMDGINLGLKKLFIDNVKSNTNELKNSLDFMIGGILDNTVGYLYIKDENNVPQMSPGNYIMVRSLGDGWYLYKTT